MSKYFVELKGDIADLKALTDWFPNGDVHVIQEEGKYYLHANELEHCNSPDSALEVGDGLLHELCAVGLMIWPSHQRPGVEAVIEQKEGDQRKRYLYMSMIDTLRGSDWIDLEVNGNQQAAKSLTAAQEILTVSRNSTHINLALLIWSAPHRTWHRLYRILEELERELGCTVNSAGFCSSNERDRFTQSANSASVAGHDARHASGKFAPPKRPMSLSEATSFINAQLQQTISAVKKRD